MTNTNVNIFDLMLGNPSNSINNQLGILAPNGETDVLNGEMPEQSFDMIFGNMLQSVAPELLGRTDGLVKPQENQVLSQLLPQQMEVEADVDENVIMFNKELQEMIPQKSSIQNINIKEILANQNVELEDGQYKVLSKEVVDSKVAMTIESANGKQLTISLPIDSIQNGNSVGSNGRSSIENSYYLKELESLVEKVDIQQIEIKSSDTKLSQSALKPVEISLVGEQNSSALTLKASLKKNQIKISELQTTSSHQKAAVLDESGLFDEKVVINQPQSNKLIENVTVGSKGQMINNTLNANQQLSLKGETLNQTTEQVGSNFNIYITDTADNIETKENIQQVRMQLPENIKSVLRPNGQAVVIKMNPENLGPAKLSLSFSGGKLRAKLAVSSLNAKQVLDGSMNKLVDQLQKININVEKIDVTLDGQQNQNEDFQQKQQWQRKMSYKNIDLAQFEENEIEQSVQNSSVSAIQQVANGSVNFLA